MAEEAATVEARVRSALMRFLHPPAAGAMAGGWPFGRGVYLSDVAALICTVPGVAAVESLQLLVGLASMAMASPVEPSARLRRRNAVEDDLTER